MPDKIINAVQAYEQRTGKTLNTNDQRNKLLDLMAENQLQQKRHFKKYKLFLAKYQQLRRDEHAIKQQIVELYERVRGV